MDWYEVTGKYHTATIPHAGRLSSLSEEWQRELAALWRLEADANNGGYLQFVVNFGRETYLYASQALKKIGARRMAEIVDLCQALIDEHVDRESASPIQLQKLMRNRVIRGDGQVIESSESTLPDIVYDRIYELSYEFMSYPENIAGLGAEYYKSVVD